MSQPNALSGAEIDRAADRRRRDSAWLEAQLADPNARAVVLSDAGVRGSVEGLELIPIAAAIPGLDAAGPAPVLLGIDADGPLFAIDEDLPRAGKRARLIGAGGMRGEAPPQADGRVGLRVAAQSFPQQQGGLLSYAAATLNWHRTHQFCGVCGGTTESAEGGMVRNCTVCGTHHHPRTDPVVIMLVTDDARGRVLLGRQAVWPQRRYSTLAGFVSPGEALEEAVAREVLEEVGVTVGPPSYRSSQPWPFPLSLMLGFHVPYVAGEIGGTDDELEHAAWFTREEVADATGDDSWDEPRPGTGLLLPPKSAIARQLIEAWLAE